MRIDMEKAAATDLSDRQKLRNLIHRLQSKLTSPGGELDETIWIALGHRDVIENGNVVSTAKVRPQDWSTNHKIAQTLIPEGFTLTIEDKGTWGLVTIAKDGESYAAKGFGAAMAITAAVLKRLYFQKYGGPVDEPSY